jgi:hypothetical protein
MRKKIRIELVASLLAGHIRSYEIVKMVNAAGVTFKARAYGLGDFVPSELADEFARDNRWEVNITK